MVARYLEKKERNFEHVFLSKRPSDIDVFISESGMLPIADIVLPSSSALKPIAFLFQILKSFPHL